MQTPTNSLAKMEGEGGGRTHSHLNTTQITTKPSNRTTLVAHVALAMESGSGFGVSELVTWLDSQWCGCSRAETPCLEG